MTTPPTIEERVSRLEGGYEHLATKADLERVRADLMGEIGNLRSDTTADIGSVRAEIKESRISTILWLTGIMIALLGAVVALLKAWPG